METQTAGQVSDQSERLFLRFADSDDDIRAAQALRWQVFYDEMGARAGTPMNGLDADHYDHACDHLLVVDRNGGVEKVVGTYRLLRQSVAEAHDGFYTAAEYDLTALTGTAPDRGELLELGRSCVLPAYRNSGTINLLWRGIADYLNRHRIGLMIGCASFAGVDPESHADALAYLHHHHLAPRELRATAHAACRVDMALRPLGGYDARLAMRSLPPLIKGYLRVGAMVGDGAFIDRAFNTIDVFMIMPVDRISQRYADRFRAATAA